MEWGRSNRTFFRFHLSVFRFLCPSKIGGRARSAEGVCQFLPFPFSPFIIPPPLRSSPCLRGTKRVFRRMTECHSVPSEGSTTQCDVGKRSNAPEGVWLFPSFQFSVLTSAPPGVDLRFRSQCFTSLFMSLSLFRASRGVRLFMSRFRSCWRMSSRMGSSNWKKLSCVPVSLSFLLPAARPVPTSS